MRRVIHALLVWVMVIAMPLQGLAATAMGRCGPAHPAGGAAHAHAHAHAAVQAPAQVSRAGHDDHHAPLGDAHHDHATAAAVDVPHASAHPAFERPGEAGDSSHASPHVCSICASCCTAFPLPARFVMLGVSRPAHAVQASPVVPVASPALDGLDRPPRTDLA